MICIQAAMKRVLSLINQACLFFSGGLDGLCWPGLAWQSLVRENGIDENGLGRRDVGDEGAAIFRRGLAIVDGLVGEKAEWRWKDIMVVKYGWELGEGRRRVGVGVGC